MFLLEIKGEWVFTMDIPLCRGNLVPGKILKVFTDSSSNDFMKCIITSYNDKILIASLRDGISYDSSILSQYEGNVVYIEEINNSSGTPHRFIITKSTDLFKPAVVQPVVIKKKKEDDLISEIRGDE